MVPIMEQLPTRLGMKIRKTQNYWNVFFSCISNLYACKYQNPKTWILSFHGISMSLKISFILDLHSFGTAM